MYRILLADDEGIMLESMKHIIESNYGKECEIHLAKTGRSVISIAQEYPPDICFVDIHMPGISGIQAIKEIQKFNSSVIFIIITAYDKFDYAQEAVNLGVMEFLTKPMNRRVFLDTCQKAMQKVDARRQKQSDDLSIREKLEIVVPMIESGYINNLLLQDEGHEWQEHYRQLLDISEENAYILVIEFGDQQEDGHLTNAVGASVRVNQSYNAMREIAQVFFHCLVGPIMGNTIVLLVPHEESVVEYEERVEILEQARNLVHKLENRIDTSFRCGIGRTRSLSTGMKESYREALKALRETDSHVSHVADIPAAQEIDGVYPRDLELQMIKKVLAKDVTAAKNYADQFYQWMEEQQGSTWEDRQIKVLELVMTIEREIFISGDAKYGFGHRGNYIRETQSCRADHDLKEWFLGKVQEIGQNIDITKEEETSSVIGKAKAYIQENYDRELTLDEVSRKVGISPYYFSKLFKQETGQNFIEFLTGLRLQKAKELLSASQYSIKEICGMCGYSDPNYFSRIFKKSEGVTPSEYKDRLGGA